tara:strand:+ start:3933 stop:4268 length:336 start_codon:yes stop_codon:yes gene_type:complete
MEYTFVKLGGDKYPIKFGFNALRKYSMKTGTTLNDLNKLGAEMSLNDALVLIHCGIEDGYRAAKQDCEITIDELADKMDGDMDSIARCMDVLTNMMGGNNEKKQKPKRAKS